jgi:hypothetical protein
MFGQNAEISSVTLECTCTNHEELKDWSSLKVKISVEAGGFIDTIK